MKRCPKCFGYIRRMGHIEKPFYCPECKEWFSNEEVTPKQTNADRIRSMTNEELANWITGIHLLTKEVGSFGEVSDKWLNWLKEEVTDKGNAE